MGKIFLSEANKMDGVAPRATLCAQVLKWSSSLGRKQRNHTFFAFAVTVCQRLGPAVLV